MQFTYPDKIKPYVRMTQRGKWVDPQAREYMASKTRLALTLKQEMNISGYVPIPSKVPFVVSLTYQAPNVYQFDLDNVLKAVMDAAQGVVFPDDRWCVEVQHLTKQRGRYSLLLEIQPAQPELTQLLPLIPAIEAEFETIYPQRPE